VFNSRNTYCLTKIHKNAHKIDYNHDTGSKLENLLLFDINIVSSVSAQKLKCPSSSRFVPEPFQLGSAQLGKFQLKLITKLGIVYLNAQTLRHLASSSPQVQRYKENIM
jgi:hypothetical protein